MVTFAGPGRMGMKPWVCGVIVKLPSVRPLLVRLRTLVVVMPYVSSADRLSGVASMHGLSQVRCRSCVTVTDAATLSTAWSGR